MTLRPQIGYWGPPHGESGIDQGMFKVQTDLGHTFDFFRRRGQFGALVVAPDSTTICIIPSDVTLSVSGYKISTQINPWGPNRIAIPYTTLYNDTGGVYNSFLFQTMDAINSLTGTGHLMELHSECNANNSVQPSAGTPAQYRLWFAYIRSVFEGGPTASGQTHTPIVQPGKVIYITSFIASGFKKNPTDPLYWTNWVPDLTKVDLIGVDHYSHGGVGDPNPLSDQYAEAIDPVYQAVLTTYGKPFGVFENGAEELAADVNFKANYYKNAFAYLASKDRVLWPVSFFTDYPDYDYDSSPQAYTAFGVGWTNLLNSGGNPPPAPSITSFSPTFGPSGTLVTLTGTGFTGVTNVLIGTLTCAFTFLSDVQVRVTIPAAAVSGKFTVTTPGGSAISGANFTVSTPPAVPTITSFNPSVGPIGTTVFINGTNFIAVTQVVIGTKPTVFTIISSTQVSAVVASGAVTGVIAVTASGGTATSSTNFVVGNATPTIISISPTHAPISAIVQIVGTGFTS